MEETRNTAITFAKDLQTGDEIVLANHARVILEITPYEDTLYMRFAELIVDGLKFPTGHFAEKYDTFSKILP